MEFKNINITRTNILDIECIARQLREHKHTLNDITDFPRSSGNDGKILAVVNNVPTWIFNPGVPPLAGQAGKFLTTDGIQTIWQNIPVQQQSDWNESDNSQFSYIKNKPYIPQNLSDLNNDAGYVLSNRTLTINGISYSLAFDRTWNLTTTEIPEGNKLYYTDGRARASLSLTTNDNHGPATYNNLTGVFNIPNYTLVGLGGVPLTRTITINGTTYDLSSNRTWTLTTSDIAEGTNLYYTDARVRAAISFIAGIANYNSTTGVITIPTTTAHISEDGNLYYTDARVLAYGNTQWVQLDGAYSNPTWITDLAWAKITGTPTTLFGYGISDAYTKGEVDTLLTSYLLISNFNSTFDARLALKTTSDLAEGSNLYFTTSRARTSLSFSAGSGAYNSTTGVITIPTDNNQIANSAGYITTINGIAAGGELSGTYPNPTLVNSAVIGKVLTGLNVTGGSIVDTDSILSAFGKAQNQINGLMGGATYQGVWNASTNSPSITSSTGTKGHYYVVNVAGSTNIDGITDWKVGDWIIFNGVTWDKVDNTDAVSSVNGYVGSVSLVTGDILEGDGTIPGRPSQLFFTAARAQAAISSSATGLTYNSTTGVFTITSGYVIPTTTQETNWNLAYTQTRQWDGGATGLVAATGRTSLGLGTMAVESASNYYTTTQIQNFFSGASAMTGYNKSNWDAVYAWYQTGPLSPYLLKSGGIMTGTLTLHSISGVAQTVANVRGTYLHLGDWGVDRTAAGAILVNTAYRADYATALFNMNISQFTNDSGYITAGALTPYLPLAGGSMTGKIISPAIGADVYGGSIELRERGYVLATQSDWSYAPGITLHWGNRYAIRFGADYLGNLAVDNVILATRPWVQSQGYLTAEVDTLQSVTTRGATSNNPTSFTGTLYARKAQTAGNYTTAALWTESHDNTTTGIAFHINGIVGKFLEMRTDQILYWDGNVVLHSGNANYAWNMNQYVRTTDSPTFQGLTLRNDLTVGAWQNSSNILMADGDEGTRYIHCNSNRIGFLTQSGSWSAWSDDSGTFGSDYQIYSNSSMSAPIYYDSQDSFYYVDPNGSSRLVNLGLGGITPDVRLSISGDAHVSGYFYMGGAAGSVGGWGTRMLTSGGVLTINTNGFVLNRVGYGGGTLISTDGDRVGLGSTDFTYTASDNTAVVGSIANNKVFVDGSIQLNGANDAIVFGRGTGSFLKDEELGFGWGGGWYMVDGSYIRSRNDKIPYTATYFLAGGSMRAPIFYDSDDTAFYADFASGTNIRYLNINGTWGSSPFSSGHAQLNITGSYPSITLRQTDNSQLYTLLHTADAFYMYVGRGATNGTDWNWGLKVLPTQDGNYVEARTSLRAPIFYDSQDTGYYLDPNGTSNLNQITAATRARWGHSSFWTNRPSITTDVNHWTGSNGWGLDYGNWDNAWKGGFSGWDIWGTGSAHPQGAGYIHAQGIVSGQHYVTSDGSQGYGWMMVGAHNATENRYWLRGKWATSTSGWVEMITTGNIASQTVYNSDLLDGYHGSNYIGLNGNSYYQVNTWLQMNGSHGIYWPGYYGAHIEANISGTYGSIGIRGDKNGWAGIYFSATANTLMMNPTESGHYNQSYGWQFRWYQGTLYNSRSTYGGGTEFTVLDSGNYNSWAPSLTGGNASGTWNINVTGFADHLRTTYAGGVQTNPQVYFSNTIGLKVAMTGVWSVWSDTVWINGYSGGDVPYMVALHTLRNGQPRIAVSTQTHGSSSYGTIYELLSSWNAPYALAMDQYVNIGSGPTFAEVYTNGWFRNNEANEGLYNQATTQHWSSNTNGYWDCSSTTTVSGIRFYTGGHVSALRGFVYADNGSNIGFLNSGGSWSLRMDNSGNAYVTGSVNAPSFYESSDMRIKTLVQDDYIVNGIENVKTKLYFKNGSIEVGYYAQDLQDILPSAVNANGDGMLNLSYREVHTAKIAYLEKKIIELENKIKELQII